MRSGAKESNHRIQTFIRSKGNRRAPGASTHKLKKGSGPTQLSASSLALTSITSDHHDLITKLILDFQINPIKAYTLVLASKEAVNVQLEAWQFREIKPRNPAGWMIQAIENRYGPPASYLIHKRQQQQRAEHEVMKMKIQSCAICDDKGFRFVRSTQYPNGAMRQCTHDPKFESRYETADPKDGSTTRISPGALKWPRLGETPGDDKRPADISSRP